MEARADQGIEVLRSETRNEMQEMRHAMEAMHTRSVGLESTLNNMTVQLQQVVNLSMTHNNSTNVAADNRSVTLQYFIPAKKESTSSATMESDSSMRQAEDGNKGEKGGTRQQKPGGSPDGRYSASEWETYCGENGVALMPNNQQRPNNYNTTSARNFSFRRKDLPSPFRHFNDFPNADQFLQYIRFEIKCCCKLDPPDLTEENSYLWTTEILKSAFDERQRNRIYATGLINRWESSSCTLSNLANAV